MDVLLVSLGDDLTEMRALVHSAGYAIKGDFVQRRPRPDPRYFVGKGKLEDLKKEVKENEVATVVFAGTLRASQHFELEKALKVPCFDRLRVILEIFTTRANSREAKLQVELAMLQYEIPILKEWIHAGVSGERPGFMSGGEYRVDSYYETVKRKMIKIRGALETIRKERMLRRDHRQERGFFQVSIAGYANAGKSSLFNALSGETVLVEDRLFTTLSTTTRTLDGRTKRILLTDTVGFVGDVPLWLVEAFHSTFEEVYASDLVLLLLDASDSEEVLEEKLRLALRTLVPGATPDRIQPILTKADLVEEMRLEKARAILGNSDLSRAPLSVSTKIEEGVERLRTLILEEFRYPISLTVQIRQDENTGAFLNWLHEQTDVLTMDSASGSLEIRLRCRERDLPAIQARAYIVAGPLTPT